MDAKGLFAELKDAQARLGEALADVAQQRSVLHAVEINLAESIRQGDSTGDRLSDLVLRLAGWNQGLLDACRALEGSLAGKEGQFVLVDFADEVPYKHTFGQGYASESKRFYRIGVLEGCELIEAKAESMVFGGDTGLISLSVSRFITGVQYPVYGRGTVQLPEPQEGNILTYRYHGGFGHKGNPNTLAKLCLAGGHSGNGIFIGDEEVERWLKEHSMEGLFKPVAAKLRRILAGDIVET